MQKVSEILSLGKALNFYEKLLTLDLKKPPSFVRNHPDYLKISPEDLIKLGV